MIPSNRRKRAILRDRRRWESAHPLLCRCPECVDYGTFLGLPDSPWEVLQGVTLVDDEGSHMFVRAQQLADEPQLFSRLTGYEMFLMARYGPKPTEGQRLFRAGHLSDAEPHLAREILGDEAMDQLAAIRAITSLSASTTPSVIDQDGRTVATPDGVLDWGPGTEVPRDYVPPGQRDYLLPAQAEEGDDDAEA